MDPNTGNILKISPKMCGFQRSIIWHKYFCSTKNATSKLFGEKRRQFQFQCHWHKLNVTQKTFFHTKSFEFFTHFPTKPTDELNVLLNMCWESHLFLPPFFLGFSPVPKSVFRFDLRHLWSFVFAVNPEKLLLSLSNKKRFLSPLSFSSRRRFDTLFQVFCFYLKKRIYKKVNCEPTYLGTPLKFNRRLNCVTVSSDGLPKFVGKLLVFGFLQLLGLIFANLMTVL